MKSSNKILLFLSVLIFMNSINAFAYKDGIHFYLTYSLAYWCGLDDYSFDEESTEAYAIAWANATTDDVSETDPGVRPDQWFDSSRPEIRRRFHFPVNHFGEVVSRGSDSAYRNVQYAIGLNRRRSSEIFAFGIGIHTLQDSWSHEGYGPEVGHAWTTEPDYPHSDPNRAVEMAEASWQMLDRWMLKSHHKHCKIQFQEVASLVKTWSQTYLGNTESLNEAWKKNAEAVAQKPVPRYLKSNDERWLEQFLLSAKKLWPESTSVLEMKFYQEF